MDKKKIITTILKEVGIVSAIVLVPIIILLVYSSVITDLDGVFSVVIIAACVLIPFYGAPWYLIRKYAKGTAKKVLYILLVLYIPAISVLTGDKQEMIASTTDFIYGLLNVALPILIIMLVITGVSYFRSNILKIDRSGESGKITRLKGYHLYGLSANEGEKVFAELYQDRIVFRYAVDEEESVDKDRIVSISSHTQQEIVGQITTEKRKGSVTSAMAALNGDWGAALFFGNRPSTYETKNKVETNWFLEVDTTTISIILQVKSMSALRQFVDLCNRTLKPSRDYEDNYDEELDDFNEERPSLDTRIDVDTMDGTTFEHFCADLLRVNGWTDVRVTRGSGDHGIDITAEKDDIKWGFQCKRWNGTKVDAVAVGQTYKGKAIYKCDMVVIITTSTLTAQAESEAKQLDIKVWGRGKIRQLMDKLDNADNYYLSA